MSCCARCGEHGCACGCGVRPGTPLSLYNRPGLPALRYRAGTYGEFVATMEAALSSATVPALAGLRTRDPDDPAIALLDAWAVVADVLTFYQERIANEGYLRTATERFSLAGIARLVGYEPRPGIAAGVHLAYTLDDTAAPVTIPAGARGQSVPGPGEKMQSFETSDDLLARPEWNRLAPRIRRLEQITRASALTRKTLTLAGAATRLGPGDRLLFVFGDKAGQQIVRRVESVEPDFAPGHDRLQVTLEASERPAQDMVDEFLKLRDDLEEKIPTPGPPTGPAAQVLAIVQAVDSYLLGGTISDLEQCLTFVSKHSTGDPKAIAHRFLEAFPPSKEPTTRSPGSLRDIIGKLGAVPSNPGAGSPLGTRTLHDAGDAVPRLLARFQPALGDVLYGAWRNLFVSTSVPTLRALYALRVKAPLFAYSLPPIREFLESAGAASESAEVVHLDAVYDGIVADSWALVARGPEGPRQSDEAPPTQQIVAARVTTATSVTHTEQRVFGDGSARDVTAPCTELVLEPVLERAVAFESLPPTTLVLAQSEPLRLAGDPVDVITGSEIELEDLYDGFEPGRLVIVTGERRDVLDVDGAPVPGIQGGEVARIADVKQADDARVPGDHTHTTLVLAEELTHSYAAETATIYGNVAHATHGETHTEVLGSGDARKPMQRFVLKQPPLTYVAAPTPSGVASTLEVRVNDVRWHETATPALAAPTDRVFVVRQDDDGATSVVCGGRSARVPTGSENVRATYRSGIGVAGNVKAGQVSLLATKPSGVRDVVNPLRASGGAERDGIDQIRRNAPIAVAALDRLLSLQDYADFARTFAGVGHALATRLSDDRGELVHVTIAGHDDAPIDEGSDLQRALVDALHRFGDPQVRVVVATRELVALVVRATVALDPDYAWKFVEPTLRAALVDRFAFTRRTLGAPAYASEAIAALQGVPGVRFVDLDTFDGISETELADQAALQTKLDALGDGYQPKAVVPVEPAHLEGSTIRPAQLAYVVPTVTELVSLAPR